MSNFIKKGKLFFMSALTAFIMISALVIQCPEPLYAGGRYQPDEIVAVDFIAQFGVLYTGSRASQIKGPTLNQDVFALYCPSARNVVITTTHNDPNAGIEPATGFGYTVNGTAYYSMGNYGNSQTVYMKQGSNIISVEAFRYTYNDATYTIRFS